MSEETARLHELLGTMTDAKVALTGVCLVTLHRGDRALVDALSDVSEFLGSGGMSELDGYLDAALAQRACRVIPPEERRWWGKLMVALAEDGDGRAFDRVEELLQRRVAN